ncbi:hypothetical protein MMPV_000626 [Pyropia vietnamensis]
MRGLGTATITADANDALSIGALPSVVPYNHTGIEARADLSDTSAQVHGVAEVDTLTVKTDGLVVYALRGRTLRMVTTACTGTVLEDEIPLFHTAPGRGIAKEVTTGFIASRSRTRRPESFSRCELLPIVTLLRAAGALAKSLGDATASITRLDAADASIGSMSVTITFALGRCSIVSCYCSRLCELVDDHGPTNACIQHVAIDDSAVQATCLSSGTSVGSVLNESSLREAGSSAFFATTLEHLVWDDCDAAVSEVTALRRAAGAPADAPLRLVQVVKTDNLHCDERIYAAHDVDDAAYVVTFCQTDPLYIVSIADLTAMVATGKLKVPDYSYVHSLGDGRLFGVGQNADAASGCWERVKIPLLDVADVAAPREVAAWADSAVASVSSVERDHRWFRHGPSARLTVLPVCAYKHGACRVGAVLIRLTNSSVAKVGRLAHPPRPAPADLKHTPTQTVERVLVIGCDWWLS